MNREYHLQVKEEAALTAQWAWQRLPHWAALSWRGSFGRVQLDFGTDPASPCVRRRSSLGNIFLESKEGFHRNFSFILNKFKREI